MLRTAVPPVVLGKCVTHGHRVKGLAAGAQIIKAEMVLWTAGFVLLTLVINAPLLPYVLRWTGLSKGACCAPDPAESKGTLLMPGALCGVSRSLRSYTSRSAL